MISIQESNEWHWNVNGQGKHLLCCKIIIQPNNYFHDSFWLIEKGQIEAENCLSGLNPGSGAPKQGHPSSDMPTGRFYFDVGRLVYTRFLDTSGFFFVGGELQLGEGQGGVVNFRTSIDYKFLKRPFSPHCKFNVKNFFRGGGEDNFEHSP